MDNTQERRNLEVVFPPSTCDFNSDPKVDIVCIHGLGGDSIGTWTASNKKTWISDPDFWGDMKHDVRVLTFNYNANVFVNGTVTRIGDHANDLLERLIVRRTRCKGRPLIMVAHSLGGLVAKRARIMSQDSKRYDDIRESMTAMIFLGTPHLGSEHAESLGVLQKLARWATWRPASTTNLTEELQVFSPTILDINRSFMRDISRPLELVCFFETVETRIPTLKGAQLIVDPGSARIDGNDAHNHSMDCNHTDLCKFETPRDARFCDLWDQLDAVVQRAIAHAEQVKQEENDLRELFKKLPKPNQDAVQMPEARNNLTDNKLETPSLNQKAAVKEPTERPIPLDHRSRESFLSSLRGWTPANFGHEGDDVFRPFPGTCEWIFDTTEVYTNWLQSDESRLLFITGASGCGKSFIAKHIRSHLTRDVNPGVTVLTFFCNATRSAQNEAPLLQYFIHELIDKIPELYKHAAVNYKDRDQSSPPLKTDALLDILQSILKDDGVGKIFFVIDGLDECDSNFIRRFLYGLDVMLKDNTPGGVRRKNKARIVILCRPTHSISGWLSEHVHLAIKSSQIEPDISKYVDAQITRIDREKQFEIAPRLLSAVIKDLARGVFLWVRNIIRELEDLNDTSAAGVWAVLNRCPHDMEKYYALSLSELKEKGHTDMETLINLLLYCFRSLSINECCDALNVFLQQDMKKSSLTNKIRSTCSRLVSVNDDGEVQLVHYSLREYLNSTRNPVEGHVSLARVCMIYLSQDCSEQLISSAKNIQQLNLKPGERAGARDHPFLMYAIIFWAQHLKQTRDGVVDLSSVVSKFLNPKRPYLSAWDQMYSIVTGSTSEYFKRPTLHILATYGLKNVLERAEILPAAEMSTWEWHLRYMHNKIGTEKLFKIQESWDCRGPYGMTMLHFASINDESETLEFILSNWSPINWCNNGGVTPLHSAATTGSKECAEILLRKGVDPNIKTNQGVTALLFACGAEKDDVVDILLQDPTSVNTANQDGITPLEQAIRERKVVQVTSLLEKGSDVNQKMSDGTRAIAYAIQNNIHWLFDLLIPHVSLDIPCNAEFTPLLLAVLSRDEGFVDAILKRDADVDLATFDSRGWTALQIAVDYEYTKIVKLLLENGASQKLLTRDKKAPIHRAARSGSLEICELLVEYGCDLNNLDSFDRTPLGLAAWEGHGAIVQLLLDNGADATIEDKVGSFSPLVGAAYYDRTSAIKAILESANPPDINASRKNGRSAAYYAATQGFLATLQILISHDADLNACDEFGDSVLLNTVRNGHEKIVEVLLQNGADATRATEKGWTALHSCACRGQTNIARHILKKCGSQIVNKESGENGTPIYQACLAGSYSMVVELLRYGADVTFKTGITVFEAACLGGDLKTIILLLVRTGTPFDESGALGRTPFLLTCLNGRRKAAEYFLRRGADLHHTEVDGCTGLHLAISSKSDERLQLIKLLLSDSYKSDIDAVDKQNESGLFKACEQNDPEVTKLLLDAGADPQLYEHAIGWTPLARSVVRGYYDVTKVLLRNERVKVNCLDFKLRNPLHLALTLNRRPMVSLIFAEMQPNATNSIEALEYELLSQGDTYGKKPHHYAVRISDDTVVRKRALEEAIKYLSLPPGYMTPMKMEFAWLGKALMYLDDDENAIFSYQRRVSFCWHKGVRMFAHQATCDNCGVDSIIQGTRNVCRFCSDIDLCGDCKKLYDKGQCGDRLALCRDDRFLAVHSPHDKIEDYPENSREAFSVDPELVEAWLDRMAKKYLQDRFHRTASTDIEGKMHPSNLHLTVLFLGMLGLVNVQMPLTKLQQAIVAAKSMQKNRVRGFRKGRALGGHDHFENSVD